MRRMRKIPKTFLKTSNLTKAILNIRHWLTNGLSVEDMAQQITEVYKTADIEDKEALGRLLTAVYDFSDRETAIRCAKLFNVFDSQDIDSRRSISFQILKDCFRREKKTTWLEGYDPSNLQCFTSAKRDFNYTDYWMVVPPAEKENVLTLCQSDSMYCIIEPSMRINLVKIVEEEGTYWIKESSDSEELAPFYCSIIGFPLTSPVYKVKLFKTILDYCLERVGFPNVDLKLRVIFSSPKTILKNRHEWIDSKPWKEVEVTEVKYMNPKDGFMMRCPKKGIFSYATDDLDKDMLRILSSSLCAASIIFSNLYNYDRFDCCSHQQIEEEANNFDLFSPYWK